jgi:ribosomal protein L11 methylase PrmA
VRIRKGEVSRLRPKHRGGYDLVCANLTSDLLLEHARKIIAQVRTDGCLVLAGILGIEFGRVQAVYEELGWRLAKAKGVREWRSGAFVAF